MKRLFEAIRSALLEPAAARPDSSILRDIGVESWVGDLPERLEANRQRRLLRLAATRIGMY